MKEIGTKILRGSALLSLAQVISYGASFLRNIILARMLGKADFGIAAILALMISAFEISSKMCIGQQVVQAKDGDSQQFTGVAHFVQFISGLVCLVLMVIFGPTISELFKQPEAAWAFSMMGLLGLCKGLEHLDFMRETRELNFKPTFVVTVVPQILTCIAAYPLAIWLQDYRVIVWLLLAKGIATTALSHMLAEQRYRWHFEKLILRRIWGFSGPLLINGLIIFAVTQGDQVLIGANYSMDVLAVYAIAVSLTLMPAQMFVQILATIMLPILSRAQDDPDLFQRQYLFCSQLVAAFGALLACVLIPFGELLVVSIFGPKYTGTGIILAWLAAANTLRTLRAAPAAAALAKGRSTFHLMTNILKSTSLFFAVIAVIAELPIHWIAICALAGECISLLGSWYLLKRRLGLLILPGVRSAIFTLCILPLLGLIHYFTAEVQSLWLGLGLTLGLASLIMLTAWRQFTELRDMVLRSLEASTVPRGIVRFAHRLGS